MLIWRRDAAPLPQRPGVRARADEGGGGGGRLPVLTSAQRWTGRQGISSSFALVVDLIMCILRRERKHVCLSFVCATLVVQCALRKQMIGQFDLLPIASVGRSSQRERLSLSGNETLTADVLYPRKRDDEYCRIGHDEGRETYRLARAPTPPSSCIPPRLHIP